MPPMELARPAGMTNAPENAAMEDDPSAYPQPEPARRPSRPARRKPHQPFPWGLTIAAVASAAALGAYFGSQHATPPRPTGDSTETAEADAPAPPAPPPDDPAASAYLKPATEDPAPAASTDATTRPIAPPPEPELTSEDISIFEAALAGQPSAPAPVSDDPATAPTDLPALDRQYLAALARGMRKAPEAEHPAWLAESESVRSSSTPSAALAELPPTLQKLRTVYLAYKNRETTAATSNSSPNSPATSNPTASTPETTTVAPPAPPAPNPAETRTFDLHVLADDGVSIFLNGQEIEGEYLVGAAHTPGAIIRLSVTAAPGDTLGFHVRNREGPAYFAAAATSGVQLLFGSSTRWDSIAAAPTTDWLRGEGKPGPSSREMRANTDYEKAVADLFEKRCSLRPTAYRIIWPGGNEAGFRYRLRPADLPKAASR